MSLLDTNPLSFIFGTKPGAGVPTYEQLQMRRKIAQSLLGEKSRYPKTFGEGLSAIGEAIGERGMMSRLDAMEQAREAQIGPEYNRAMGNPATAAGATPMSYAPSTDMPPLANIAAASNGPIPGMAGTPTPVEDGGYNALDQGANLRDQRTNYMQQLEKDPAAKLKLAALMSAEEGRGGPNSSARTALAETVFNRGVSRGYGDVNKVMDPRYYQPMHDGSGNYAKHLALVQSDPAYRAQLFSEIGNVAGGSNVSNLATDNASGTVAANSRRNTSEGWTAPNGEYFARKDVRPDVHGPGPVSQTADWYARTALPPAPGPQSSVVDPGLNQSVALNQAEPPAPTGQPTAFSGQPASDAPPIGMPDARDAITSALAPRPAPVAAPPVPAAPAGPQIAQAPPQQQIRVPARRPVEPDPPQMTQQMSDIAVLSGKLSPDDPRQSGLKLRYQQLQATEQAKYKQKLDAYEYERKREDEAPKKEADLINAQADASIKKEEARIVGRTGMKPSELYKRLDEDKFSVNQTIKSQSAQQLARKAIRDGVITGYGANMRVASAKFADWAWNNGLKGDLAANTEIMKASLDAGLSEAIKTVNGEGGSQVSNIDVKIAQGIQGSDPNLQMKTIQTIMDRAAEINHRKINSYEEKVDRYLSGEKAELNYKTSSATIPRDKLEMFLKNASGPDAEQHKKFFNDVYGPGAAELEIARLKRAQRRQGKGD